MADPRFINPITVFASIGGITIDKTKRLNEKYAQIITENPIEGSASVSEHKYRRPTLIQINGEIFDTPATNLVGSYVSTLGLAKTKFDALLSLAASDETFEIMDGIHLLDGFQFESLDLVKENSRYSIEFNATLKQVIEVQGFSFVPLAPLNLSAIALRIAYGTSILSSSGSIATQTVEPFGVLL